MRSYVNQLYKLAKTIAKDKIKAFISTGMSTLDEIDKTVEIFEKENCKFELMHCISQYHLKINMRI